MSQENVELVRRSYDAFNRRDLDAFLTFMDPDVEAIPRTLGIEGGTYHGHDGVRSWWENLLAIFDDFSVEPIEVRSSGDLTIATVRIRGQGAGSGVLVEETVWQVAEVRDRKCVHWRTYRSRTEALEAAGLREWAMSQENVEIARRVFEAFNEGVRQGDFGAAFDLDALADDAEWIPVPLAGAAPVYHGREGFTEFMNSWTEDFEDWSIRLDRLIDAGGNRVVATGHQSATGKASGVPVAWHFGQIFELEGGRVTRIQIYADPAQALEAAGLKE